MAGEEPGLEEALTACGSGFERIERLIVTHAHIDHIGGLQGLLSRHDVPVLMAAQELPLATGEQDLQSWGMRASLLAKQQDKTALA